jgi:hypothetical protein
MSCQTFPEWGIARSYNFTRVILNLNSSYKDVSQGKKQQAMKENIFICMVANWISTSPLTSAMEDVSLW